LARNTFRKGKVAELHRHLTAIGPPANPYALRFVGYLVHLKLGPGTTRR